MKFFISLLLVLSFVNNSYCQGYIPLIDTTLEWKSCFNYYKNGQSTGAPITYRFSNKDTIFKNDTFRILMAYTAVDTFVMGVLREDTTARKAYGFYDGDTAEYLMYDFSFPNPTIDDTLWINPNEPDSNYKVSVFSFQDFSGKTRKNVQLCCGYRYYNTTKYKVDYIDWLEGIGSNAGLIHNIIVNKLPQFRYPNTPIRDVHFLGIRSAGKIGHGNPLVLFTCDFDTSLVSVEKMPKKEHGINIYYTNEGEVLIRALSDITNIEIHSIDGRLLHFWNDINNSEFSLPKTGFEIGWYLIKIRMNKEFISYQKLLINY